MRALATSGSKNYKRGCSSYFRELKMIFDNKIHAHTVIVADVVEPMLGWDFLSQHRAVIVTHDPHTYFQCTCEAASLSSPRSNFVPYRRPVKQRTVPSASEFRCCTGTTSGSEILPGISKAGQSSVFQRSYSQELRTSEANLQREQDRFLGAQPSAQFPGYLQGGGQVSQFIPSAWSNSLH